MEQDVRVELRAAGNRPGELPVCFSALRNRDLYYQFRYALTQSTYSATVMMWNQGLDRWETKNWQSLNDCKISFVGKISVYFRSHPGRCN